MILISVLFLYLNISYVQVYTVIIILYFILRIEFITNIYVATHLYVEIRV